MLCKSFKITLTVRLATYSRNKDGVNLKQIWFSSWSHFTSFLTPILTCTPQTLISAALWTVGQLQSPTIIWGQLCTEFILKIKVLLKFKCNAERDPSVSHCVLRVHGREKLLKERVFRLWTTRDMNVGALLSARGLRGTRERVVSVCVFGELLNICVSEAVISLEKQKNEVGDLSYFIISHSPTAHTRACTNTYFY